MPYRQIIPSPYLDKLPKLSEFYKKMPAEPPPPPPQAGAAPNLDPIWQQSIDGMGDPRSRDRVSNGQAEPSTPFSYRTSDNLLRHLPEPARALLQRLDDAATEARDRTVALMRHIYAAEERVSCAALDVAATIKAAGLREITTLQDAREMIANDSWPEGYGGPQREHVRVIVAAGDRLAAAQAEVQRLRERQRAHNDATAPIAALHDRVLRAVGRSRPPFKPVELPAVDAKKAEKVLTEARREITTLAAEIERVEGPAVHPDDLMEVATAAVRQHAVTAHSFLQRGKAGALTLREPIPGLEVGDQAPVRPLALLCGIVPEATARWIADALPADPALPRLADRAQALVAVRERLRQAELLERAAVAALGDPLHRLAERSDSDPLLVLMVEAAR